MNRRTFLETGLGGVALAAAPALLTAADSDAIKPRIPIGFLGASYSHGPDKIKCGFGRELPKPKTLPKLDGGCAGHS